MHVRMFNPTSIQQVACLACSYKSSKHAPLKPFGHPPYSPFKPPSSNIKPNPTNTTTTKNLHVTAPIPPKPLFIISNRTYYAAD